MSNGVDTSYVLRHEGAKSHVSLAFLDNRNDAHYQFYKDHASLALPEQMPDFKAGDIILFGSFYAINPVIRDYTRKFLQTAKDAGCILYYDINFRSSHINDLPLTMDNILENFALSTVIRGSIEDFNNLFGMSDVDEIYEKKIRPYCTCFICTDADKPVQVRTPHLRNAFPAKKIETVSTIGAGDNFNAGFCYALMHEGINKADALQSAELAIWQTLVSTAQRFSSCVCQTLDNYVPVGFDPEKN
jgi:fructokinase